MNGVNFGYGKYMNGSCFSLGLVYEWGGVRGLQQHVRNQNHGKLPPRGLVPKTQNLQHVVSSNRVIISILVISQSVTNTQIYCEHHIVN